MKIVLIGLILNLTFIYGCSDFRSGNQSGVSKMLYDELKAISDTTSENHIISEYSLFIVAFTLESSNCYLYIIPSPYYTKERVKGSIEIDGNVFLFYFDDTFCVNSFLDVEMLELAVPIDKFEEEKDFFEENQIYDPRGIKYIIHNSDSLEVIHRGQF